MIKYSLIVTTVALLLFIPNVIQVQCSQPQLNQVELLKQFPGSWKTEFSEGTTMILEFTPFGDAMMGNAKTITTDTSFNSMKYLWGYDNKNDKIIIAEIFSHTPVMEIDAGWFSSKNTFDAMLFSDITSPENALKKWKFEFKSPDLLVFTTIQNNNIVSVLEWTRIKK